VLHKATTGSLDGFKREATRISEHNVLGSEFSEAVVDQMLEAI
jgi:hypothetical protein